MDDLQSALMEDTGATGSSSHHLSDGRNDTLVTFNLRGTLIVIPATTADDHPTSVLWKVLRDVQRPRPLRDGQGHVYFNRNPTLFHAVLDAIVNAPSGESPADLIMPGLVDELRFWGIRSKRSRDDDPPVRVGHSASSALPPSGFRSYGAMEVSYAKDSPFAVTR
jgi:hypothetical protein